ncbi:MAG: hypothetical protein AAB676_12965 [Verrucomicrobiota bacterium]
MKRLILILLAPALGFAQQFSIDAYKISGGGGASTSSVYTVSGTIGQPDAGKMAGGNFTLDGGFWGVATALQAPGAPLLVLTRAGNNLTLSWDNAVTGFVLESAASLSPPISWQPVTGVVGNSITLSIPPGYRFYRLRTP